MELNFVELYKLTVLPLQKHLCSDKSQADVTDKEGKWIGFLLHVTNIKLDAQWCV